MSSLQNKLRSIRTRLQLSQGQLATQAGISRQAYMAIEAGRSVPSTEVALRLARALRTNVEDLFSLDEEATTLEADLVSGAAEEEPGRDTGATVGRVDLARVGSRLVAMSRSGRSASLHTLWPAAGRVVRSGPGNRVSVELFDEKHLRTPAVVMAGCDPTVGFLAAGVQSRGARLLWSELGSKDALRAIARGEAHIAGCHLMDEGTGSYNRPWVEQLVPEACTLVRFAVWREGIIVAEGNPKGITGAEDFARHDVRVVNRQAGSGSRAVLDQMLAAAGIPGSLVHGYEFETHGHIQVAEIVAHGFADAGIGVEAAARAFGLGFVPLHEEPYDLVVPGRFINETQVQALLDSLRDVMVRRQLSALGGYDTSGMGLPA